VTYQSRMDGDAAERYPVHDEHVLLLGPEILFAWHTLPGGESLWLPSEVSLTKQPHVATWLSNVRLSHTTTPCSENGPKALM
jgi:hypothetical protein